MQLIPSCQLLWASVDLQRPWIYTPLVEASSGGAALFVTVQAHSRVTVFVAAAAPIVRLLAAPFFRLQLAVVWLASLSLLKGLPRRPWLASRSILKGLPRRPWLASRAATPSLAGFTVPLEGAATPSCLQRFRWVACEFFLSVDVSLKHVHIQPAVSRACKQTRPLTLTRSVISRLSW